MSHWLENAYDEVGVELLQVMLEVCLQDQSVVDLASGLSGQHQLRVLAEGA